MSARTQTNENVAEMDAEELAVRVADIDDFRLTRPVLRDRVEEIVQEELQYRQAYREFDATDINSNTVQFPVPDDEMGQPKIVDEGSEFPRDQETYSRATLTFDKYGFEVALTHEAQEDAMIDVVRDQVDRQAREMAEQMNDEAFEVLQANNQGTVGDADGVFTYSDVLAGRRELMSDNYNPDLLIGDIEAVHDLLQDGNFLEASDVQSEMRRSGEVGDIAGFTVVQADDANDITGNSNPGAFMIDTDFYGYEGVREGVSTNEYTEERTQTDVFRIYSRMGWLPIDPDAAVLIEG